MIRVRFLCHAPPYMPGDVILYDDDTARSLAARGLVEVVKEVVSGAQRPMNDGGEPTRPPKDKP